MRVWAEAAKADPSILSRTRFVLVTTARAPSGSAASYLRSSDTDTRNPARAQEILVSAGGASQNMALSKSIEAFNALTQEMRTALVAAIEIIDGAPLVADLESLIEERLRMIAPRGKAVLAREQLEGWWWPRICKALQAETPNTIPVSELELKLDDIRETLKRDALPLDMENVDPSQEELDSLEEMRFVRQLHAIGLSAIRLQFAKRDFYRASAQRSQWARNRLLFAGEVGRFDSTLIEEWEPRFLQMRDGLPQGCPEVALRDAGRDLYGWVENDARFELRTIVSRFLNVGSYHILADDLRVGWHPEYYSICEDQEDESSDVG